MDRLDRATIEKALEELAARLPPNTQHSLIVVGGAALVLLYHARASTKDVDAFLLDPPTSDVLRSAVAGVATAMGLPSDWLNDGAKGYVQGLVIGDKLFERTNLTVSTLAPQQLLAMKLSAWRDDVDIDDAKLLLSKLGTARDGVWREIEPHLVPGRELKARYAFDDLWEALHGLK